jgi:hypothetical protein
MEVFEMAIAFTVQDAKDLASRRFYEDGNGGWKDGRLGQVYDLLWAVLKERGETTSRHPLLTQIETMDQEDAG